MKTRYKILILFFVFVSGVISVGLREWSSVKASTSRIRSSFTGKFTAKPSLSSKTYLNMPQNTLLTGNLLGAWSFNGQDMSGVTITDRGSGGNNGTLTNGPTAIPGIIGQALKFDGVNDFVSITDHASLDLASTFSISVWLKHTSDVYKDWEAIVTKGDSAYRMHLCGNTDFCGGSPTTDAINLAITGTGCTNNGTTSTVVPELNRWYHVVGTYDGSAAKIYIDGALDANTACTGAISTNAQNLYIGENAEATGRQWTGEMDEIRLYSAALTADEVLKLYNAGKR